MSNEEDYMMDFEKKLELAEYQIRERIEEKLWNRITRWGTIAGISLTLLTIFGFPALVSSIGNDVIKEVKKEIESETDKLADQLSKDLATLSVTKAVLESEAEKSKMILKESGQYSVQIASLNSKLEALSIEATLMRERAEKAINAAKVASEDTKNLRATFNDSTAGNPVILSWNSDDGGDGSTIGYQGPKTGYVDGDNFGDMTGRVYVTIAIYDDSDYDEGIAYNDMTSSKLLAIENDSISSWSNERVGITFSKNDRRLINKALIKLGKKVGTSVSLHYVVESANGVQTRSPSYKNTNN